MFVIQISREGISFFLLMHPVEQLSKLLHTRVQYNNS
jgi:hypothetical protein